MTSKHIRIRQDHKNTKSLHLNCYLENDIISFFMFNFLFHDHSASLNSGTFISSPFTSLFFISMSLYNFYTIPPPLTLPLPSPVVTDVCRPRRFPPLCGRAALWGSWTGIAVASGVSMWAGHGFSQNVAMMWLISCFASFLCSCLLLEPIKVHTRLFSEMLLYAHLFFYGRALLHSHHSLKPFFSSCFQQ